MTTMNLKTLRKQAKSARKARPVKDDASAARMAQEAARLAADAAEMAAADLEAANTAKAVAAQRMASSHEPNPAVSALLETLQQTLAQQTEMVNSLTAMVGSQSKRLEAAIARPVQVEAGDVEVNMPERQMPTSFTCEFDDGRTATLTPNFESVH